jgi:hypothetical protein
MKRIIVLTSILAGITLAGFATSASAKPMVPKHSLCTGQHGLFDDLPSCGGGGGNGGSTGGGGFTTPGHYEGEGGKKDTIKCKKCNN